AWDAEDRRSGAAPELTQDALLGFGEILLVNGLDEPHNHGLAGRLEVETAVYDYKWMPFRDEQLSEASLCVTACGLNRVVGRLRTAGGGGLTLEAEGQAATGNFDRLRVYAIRQRQDTQRRAGMDARLLRNCQDGADTDGSESAVDKAAVIFTDDARVHTLDAIDKCNGARTGRGFGFQGAPVLGLDERIGGFGSA